MYSNACDYIKSDVYNDISNVNITRVKVSVWLMSCTNLTKDIFVDKNKGPTLKNKKWQKFLVFLNFLKENHVGFLKGRTEGMSWRVWLLPLGNFRFPVSTQDFHGNFPNNFFFYLKNKNTNCKFISAWSNLNRYVLINF